MQSRNRKPFFLRVDIIVLTYEQKAFEIIDSPEVLTESILNIGEDNLVDLFGYSFLIVLQKLSKLFEVSLNRSL